jgi:hypothetical protein
MILLFESTRALSVGLFIYYTAHMLQVRFMREKLLLHYGWSYLVLFFRLYG